MLYSASAAADEPSKKTLVEEVLAVSSGGVVVVVVVGDAADVADADAAVAASYPGIPRVMHGA